MLKIRLKNFTDPTLRGICEDETRALDDLAARIDRERHKGSVEHLKSEYNQRVEALPKPL